MERRLATLRGVGAALASQLILLSCGGGGGDDGGVTNPPPPPPAAVATVTVAVAPTSINVGQTSQATAVLRDAQNNVLTRTVTWSSSNTAVASVNASSGVVTGVAGGTANVIATSEGRTGQAQITVAAPTTPPQISNITVTQNGQAANLAQVAGVLTVSFSVDVPAGYSGTLIVRVDTVEFLREPISALAFSTTGDGPPGAMPVNVGRQVLIDTRIAILDKNALREIGAIKNGLNIATLTVQPSAQGGQSVTQTINFTAANPIHFHGLYGFSGITAIGTDGKTYTGDDGIGAVVPATYGNEVVNGFEVILTDQKALYGHTTGGTLPVYQRITRTNLDKFTLPEFPFTGSNLTYVLDKVTIDGVTIDPQNDFLGSVQFTTDLIGSGFANTQQQVQGLTAPAGKTYVQQSPHLVEQLPGTVKGQWTVNEFNLDNEGPKKSPAAAANEPVFSFLDRMTTAGGAALWPIYGFGASNNQLSANYDFAGGLRYDRLTDISGIDQSKTEFFAATITVNNVLNLFTPQFKVSAPLNLPESNGTRPYTAGVRVYDKRGNYVDDFIRVSIGNQYNSLGNLSSSNSWGIDAGSFGFTKAPANLAYTGVPAKSTWNQSTIDPQLTWGWNVSGSSVGVPNGFLSGRGKFNGTYGFGFGTASDQFQVIQSTGGATSGSASVSLAPLFSQTFNKVGGPSSEGLYEYEFNQADNAGQSIGTSWKVSFLWDYHAPTNAGITLNGTVTAGQPATGTLTGIDNYGLKYANLGFRFAYQSPLFFGNEVYVLPARIPVPAGTGGVPNKNMSLPLSGTSPIGFWFYDPQIGTILTNNFYRADGIALQLEDMAHNLGPVTFVPLSNSAPIPTINNASSVRSSIGSTNWSTNSGQNMIDLNFNYFDPRPSGSPELSKAEWFAIPQSGLVYRLGAATTPTSVVEGTGRRLSYNMQFDVRKYCAPPGPALVFGVGYNTAYYLKPSSFFSVNIQTPVRYSNECNDQ